MARTSISKQFKGRSCTKKNCESEEKFLRLINFHPKKILFELELDEQNGTLNSQKNHQVNEQLTVITIQR